MVQITKTDYLSRKGRKEANEREGGGGGRGRGGGRALVIGALGVKGCDAARWRVWTAVRGGGGRGGRGATAVATRQAVTTTS